MACIVLPIRKNDWFLNRISHDDFDTNVMFFQYVQSFISLPLCMFCLVVTCDIVNSISPQYELS